MPRLARSCWVLAMLVMVCRFAAGAPNTIRVHADAVVTELPEAMNGGGCGIEFIEHEIMGGFDSQLVVGESFEEPHNATTGITDQWAIGGAGAAFSGAVGSTHQLVVAPRATYPLSYGGGALPALNGLQYLQMALPVSGAGPVWVQNRGLNFQGLTLKAGLEVEGWLWMATPQPQPLTVSVELRCGGNGSFASTPPLAAQNFTIRGKEWTKHNVSGLTPATGCVGDGSVVIALHSGGPLRLDMVFLQPGAEARYEGLPVRKDLAEFLLGSGMVGMRMGGGTIDTWICNGTGTHGPPGSGYVLSNFRGPRWRRQPMCGQEYPGTSAGWGWVEFADFCEAANITAAITLNERDDPVAVVEYLFGDSSTNGGALRAEDGHPHPYDPRRMLLEIGNERMPGHSDVCAGDDCIEAFFSFALRAQARANELALGKLPFVLAIWACAPQAHRCGLCPCFK
jgi:hypothetical protein